MRRIRLSVVGLLFSAAGLVAVVSNLDFQGLQKAGSDKENAQQQRQPLAQQLDAGPGANDLFNGRQVQIIGAGDDKRIITRDEDKIELVETGTSSVPFFPRTMYLPADTGSQSASGTAVVAAAPNTSVNPGNIRHEEEYTLLGLGIRTVSFLSIQVYVLGFYVRTADLTTLQARLIHRINANASTLVPSEKEELRHALLDPAKSTELWSSLLLEEDIKSCWRITPTRNTDFAHLRDGWVTGIKRGTQAASTAFAALKARDPAAVPVVDPSEYESESFGEAVKAFKDTFASKGKTAKGSIVLLVRDAKGALDILFQDLSKNDEQSIRDRQKAERIGTVADARIGRLIWMGYLAGANVSSEAARKGVVEGCVGVAARPVGSIKETV